MAKREVDKKEKRGRSRLKYRRKTKEEIEASIKPKSFKISWLKDTFPFFKKDFDDNCIRILPETWSDSGNQNWAFEVFVHRYIGVNKEHILCPQKNGAGSYCPICAEVSRAYESDDKNYANSIRAKSRFVTFILDKADKKKEILKVWEMNTLDHEELVKNSYNMKTKEYLQIDDPDDGIDLFFNCAKKPMKNGKDFDVISTVTPEQVGDRVSDDILDTICENPIPGLLIFKKSSEIESIFDGATTSSSKEENTDESVPLPETYEDVCEMEVDHLTDYLIECAGHSKKEILKLGKDELVEWVCQDLNIDIPEDSEDEQEVEKESGRERLAAIRRQRGL